jgi:hypothetical protein
MRTRDPYELQRPIQRIRDKRHFYDEIKWSQVSAKKLPLLETLIDVFFASPATLSVFVIDKQKHDPIARFGGLFEAYECLARQLVLGRERSALPLKAWSRTRALLRPRRLMGPPLRSLDP